MATDEQVMLELAAQLTPRDYEIFIARVFGRSLRSIAIHHKLSPERVRQIVARCLRRLMGAEKKWVAAERACCRIQQECKAKRIEEWSRVVASMPREPFPILPPPTYLTLEDLELSVRVFNVLRNAGKETLEQICLMSAVEFLRLRNAGRVSLRDLRTELNRIQAPHNLGE